VQLIALAEFALLGEVNSKPVLNQWLGTLGCIKIFAFGQDRLRAGCRAVARGVCFGLVLGFLPDSKHNKHILQNIFQKDYVVF
jgi:hypothetical protein